VALEALLEEYEAALSSPVRLEVLGGARRGERERLESYFAILPYFPLEEADGQAAVRNHWALRDTGFTVPWNDVLIATLARRLNCRVYAKDVHFNSMKDVLGIELYEPGPGGSYSPAGSGSSPAGR
jgi:predicted nucleic acid-binding protein